MSELDGLTAMLADLDDPVAVVTTASRDERSGCLVGFLTQCSIDPPRLMVFLSDKNRTYATALDAEALAVHFIDRDQTELAELFGGATGDEVDKFSRCDWREGPYGMPVLSDVRNWIVGQITDRVIGGDHIGFLLRPVAVHRERPLEPLSFRDVDDIDPGHEP